MFWVRHHCHIWRLSLISEAFWVTTKLKGRPVPTTTLGHCSNQHFEICLQFVVFRCPCWCGSDYWNDKTKYHKHKHKCQLQLRLKALSTNENATLAWNAPSINKCNQLCSIPFQSSRWQENFAHDLIASKITWNPSRKATIWIMSFVILTS